MATWEDGPEYAPVERPSAFDEPAAVRPLEKAPPREMPSAGAPLVEPAFDQRVEVAPLAEHHPARGPERDPEQPYAVASSVMTETDSAWSTVVHYHVQPEQHAGPVAPDPRAPITVAGTEIQHSAPQPEWLPPEPVPDAEPAPTFGAVFNAMSAPTFITLLIGGLAMAVPLFGWLSPLMFVLAFLTSGRIAYRRHWVRLAFLVGAGALGTTIIVGLLFSPVDLLAYFMLVQAVSTVVCWLVLFAVLGIVWQALAAKEPPDHPGRRTGWS
ncbi:hypothetical protein [Granulicoccus sp. GXG6511]|uniref:hypothetical protein n=1 Tax=Granulicoccus sp. GXG6511 TaxID=3381351 RepID=UPI003D7DAB1D